MFNTGLVTKAKGILDKIRYGEINYKPTKLVTPTRLIQSRSQAWVGLEKILFDIIEFSGIKTNSAVEFGVEFGYSTAALANFFKQVTGVDIFTGDEHAGHYGDIYAETSNNLKDFPNITLIKADYKDYITSANDTFDLVHVDIIHTYDDTYACGLWGAQHSSCTIFHDTQSYPDVKRAVADIAKKTNKKFYNYRKCNGLGIVF
ncbi:MAG: class I SAM-dependent methyltransferase [Cyclobacteriaceae bacterium]|nr:class I SAM-dependent methyltransferase [Cyclobacteriaceae bacterium]